MNNIDHITFVNSILKVTASTTINIENDLKQQQTEPITTLLQKAINEEKNTKNNI